MSTDLRERLARALYDTDPEYGRRDVWVEFELQHESTQDRFRKRADRLMELSGLAFSVEDTRRLDAERLRAELDRRFVLHMGPWDGAPYLKGSRSLRCVFCGESTLHDDDCPALLLRDPEQARAWLTGSDDGPGGAASGS